MEYVDYYNNHKRLRLCYSCNKPKERNSFTTITQKTPLCRECSKIKYNLYKRNTKDNRDSCSDEYIASLFCNHGSPLKRADIPKGLIDIKKEEIKLKRLIKIKKENK